MGLPSLVRHKGNGTPGRTTEVCLTGGQRLHQVLILIVGIIVLGRVDLAVKWNRISMLMRNALPCERLGLMCLASGTHRGA